MGNVDGKSHALSITGAPDGFSIQRGQLQGSKVNSTILHLPQPVE